ncbi:multidrug efflux system protein EmrA [Citrobacter koseri]|uniref:Multidrug efflux system protein EmrA n=1 Tax=Citrobacter koseri TaxID=545 RepID=A0A2X2YND9_CITKO|nr:multidrug efflux system protein EmrA [Citrobacter koseri]
MSQQDAAKEQANTRNNLRVVSIFAAAAIGLVGVLVILYAWQLPPFTRHTQFTDNAYVRGQTTFISPQVNGYITQVNVQDFVQVEKRRTADADRRPYLSPACPSGRSAVGHENRRVK